MIPKLCWNCDFCGKPEIIISEAGILYCANCRMSYGESASKVLHVGGV
jgi:ribosomal protein L37AE/L43A